MGNIYSKDAIVQVTKDFSFDSAHFLRDYEGDCSNLHGHTYLLSVTLEGSVDKRGILLDFKELKEIVNKYIVKRLDHKCINHVLPFNPTAENMVCWIYDTLAEKVDNERMWVRKIELYETPTSKATFEVER